jgi:hypothetical protein
VRFDDAKNRIGRFGATDTFEATLMAEIVKCEAGISLCGAEFAMPAKSELRDDLRIDLSRRGWLSSGNALIPCVIENMSTQGFFILSNTTFPVGAVIDLCCELFPQQFLQCRIEVVRIADSCMGAKIVEINACALNLSRQFIEERYLLGAWTKNRPVSGDTEPDEAAE